MVLPLKIISTGGAIIVFIFVVLFVYLTAKWSIKRGKEISKRFEYEKKELQTRGEKIEEIGEQINSLKIKHRQAVTKNDIKTANLLSKQIEKLERQRDNLLKKIREY